MFSYFDSWLGDPIGMLMFFLLALPGRLMALSAHEAAHAWMADKCGDPTARMLGRLTLNPLKHLDPLGTIMMLLLGVGWARPVPVNPNNYRNYRRDDLKVSLAGITMNLILFVLGYIAMALIAGLVIHFLPHFDQWELAQGEIFVTRYMGQRVLVSGEYYYSISQLFTLAPYLSDILIVPVLGRVAGYAYEMLMYFVVVNIALAVFNLIPVPPLDGYHVLNDLLLRRNLFASPKVARIAYGALLCLIFFTDLIDRLIMFVENICMNGLGTAVYALLNLIGLL